MTIVCDYCLKISFPYINRVESKDGLVTVRFWVNYMNRLLIRFFGKLYESII